MASMQCPLCDEVDSVVVPTKSRTIGHVLEDGAYRYRRLHFCKACKGHFTSLESVERPYKVGKRRKRTQPVAFSTHT